jgi:hypothetical protein
MRQRCRPVDDDGDGLRGAGCGSIDEKPPAVGRDVILVPSDNSQVGPDSRRFEKPHRRISPEVRGDPNFHRHETLIGGEVKGFFPVAPPFRLDATMVGNLPLAVRGTRKWPDIHFMGSGLVRIVGPSIVSMTANSLGSPTKRSECDRAVVSAS